MCKAKSRKLELKEKNNSLRQPSANKEVFPHRHLLQLRYPSFELKCEFQVNPYCRTHSCSEKDTGTGTQEKEEYSTAI